MKKNCTGCWIITLAILIVVMIIFTAFCISEPKTGTFVQTAFGWITSLVGITTIVAAVIMLLDAGAASLRWQDMGKYAMLILLGLLIFSPSWYAALGVVLILAISAAGDLLECRGSAKQSQETNEA